MLNSFDSFNVDCRKTSNRAFGKTGYIKCNNYINKLLLNK